MYAHLFAHASFVYAQNFYILQRFRKPQLYKFTLIEATACVMELEISSIDLILLLFASNLWTGLLLIFLYWRIQQTGRKMKITNHLLAKVFDESSSSSSRMEDKAVQGPNLCSIELRKGEQVSIDLGAEDEPSPVKECSIQIDFTETDGESEDSSDSKSHSSIVAWESRFWSDLREFGFHTELIPTDSEDDWENHT